jgi:hypothetical protein
MGAQSGRERDVLTTPIDAHLPLVVALVMALVLVCARVTRGTRWAAAVQCAVPLLIVAMTTLTDERTRLFAYGVIVAAAFGIATWERGRPARWFDDVILAVVGIALLRWIPLHDVHVTKELIVLAGSIALLFAIPRPRGAGGTPALLAVLAVAVVTPLSPGEMALFPFALAMLVISVRILDHRETARPRNRATYVIAAALMAGACFARYSLATVYVAAAIVFLVPLLHRMRPLTYAAALVVFALWPWSGIIARALPLVRNYEPAAGYARPVVSALAASEALPLGVPPHVRHVVITASGGQMARFKTGRIVGTIEATDRGGRVTRREIRIGDVADFGFMRREQFLGSRNPLPRFSPGEVRGYGANAWVWGSGRTALACTGDIATLRVIASPNLPPQSHLQIDAVEFSGQ